MPVFYRIIQINSLPPFTRFLRRLLSSVFFQVHLKLTQETLYLNGLNVLRLQKCGRYKTRICLYLILILVHL